MSDSKTFSVKRENKPGIHVTGFPADNHRAFITLRIGDNTAGGEFVVILGMADACALSIAMEDAINHAEPRAIEAADIGLLEEAA